jgi:hypothetical protein
MENSKAQAYIRLRLADLADMKLPGTPTPKEMIKVQEQWYKILTRKQGGRWLPGDGGRLEEAFDDLEASVSRWPAPADMLKLMPPRKDFTALPEPGRSEEENEEGLRRIKGIIAMLNESMTVH